MSLAVAITLALVVLASIEYLAILAHEIGHALGARVLGVPTTGFGLSWRGARIDVGRDDLILTRGQCVLIAAGGPAASLALALVAWLVGWTYPGVESLALGLGVESLALGLLNLIPFGPSDGRKIWREVRGV